MNNLDLKKIVISGVLIVVVQQVLALVLNPVFANNLQLASLLSLPLGLLISGSVSFFVLKSASMNKSGTAANGFLSGIVAIALLYLVFVIVLHGMLQTMTAMIWLVGSTVGGFFAGK